MKTNFFKKSKKTNIFNLEQNNISLDIESLDKFIEENDVKEVETNQDLWAFNNKLKNIDHIYIYPQEILLYKDLLIKQNTKSRKKDTSISVNANKLSKKIGELLSKINLIKIDKIIIDIGNKKYKLSIYNQNVSLDITDGNLDTVLLFYNKLIDLGYNVKKINIDYNVINENQVKFIDSYNYYDYDYTELDKISRSTEININYAFLESRSIHYEDYRVMVNKINEDRKLIKDETLSPLEKLLIAYDRVKRFQYNNENYEDARKLDRIAITNKINCTGYSEMMIEVLKDIDSNIKINSVRVECFDENNNLLDGHRRNIVRIDDDKYNVHGFYVLDATWDSYNTIRHPNYSMYDLYRYFLIPLRSYTKVFPHDSKIKIFNDKSKTDEQASILEPYKFTGMFNDKMENEILDYLKVDKIPDETLLKVIMKARIVEGYNEEDLPYELERLIEINNLNVDLNEVIDSTMKR